MKIGSKGNDVKAWQRFVGATPDGAFGAATVRATAAFQKENGLTADGSVNEATMAVAVKLGFVADPNAIETCLPESGAGFCGYNRERGGSDQYGTAATIAAIIGLGKKWSENHADCPLQIGDISRRGGGAFPPHASHRSGHDFDVRPFRRDGNRLPVTCFDAAYDARLTEEFVRLVRLVYPGATIFFNDPQFIKKGITAHCAGHDNHLHVRLK